MIALLATLGALASPPSADLQALVTGHFAATQTAAAARPAIDAAIERTVDSLPWAWRLFARPPLRRTTTMCPGWRLRLDDAVFGLACDGADDVDFEVRLDGTTTHEDGGEAYAVGIQVAEDASRGSTVAVTWDGPRGGQTTTWVFSQDGQLRQDCRVYSSHLPEPLRWSYRYARQD